MIKNVISVIDGQMGSSGKGKLIGEIATNKEIKLGAAITNCKPNAGHSFVDEKGNKTVFQNIPVSSVSPNTELFIGPGSAINMDVFAKEYNRVEKYLQDRKIYVHEMTPLIEVRHIEYEKNNITSGSTFEGCGAVATEKVMRDQKLKFFKGFKNAIVCSSDEWSEKLYEHLENSHEYVLLEGYQGYGLSLDHSGNFPYTTSRNVSTAQLLSDSDISPERLLQTIMIIRPFPIRISNITESGKYIYTGNNNQNPGSGIELKWSQINLSSLFGSYPFEGDIDCYPSKLNLKLAKKLLSHCPEIYLLQLLGPNYKRKNPSTLTVLEALELERLYHKSKDIKEYYTKVIEFEQEITDLSEMSTVSRKERKIYDINIESLKKACRSNTPSSIYLNFFEHLSQDHMGLKGNFKDIYFNRYLREYLSWLESELSTPISVLGTGAKNDEKIIKMNPIKPITKD